MALLTTDVGRMEIAEVNGLTLIAQLLTRATASMSEATTPSIVQLVYQLVFCLWCLSYNKDIAERMVTTELSVIPQLVKCVPLKEKVARVSLMTLKNLLGSGSGNANDQMVSSGIMRVLETLSTRRWADEDIADDITDLNDSLEVDVASLSTYDVFKAEVLSGSLEWSGGRKQPKFWKENAAKFAEGKFAVIGALVSLLKVRRGGPVGPGARPNLPPHPPRAQNENTNATTLAVACHDIGCFIQYHPDGRKVVSSFGAKEPLMLLLTNSDSEVQKQALNCTQKLMVTNWDLLNK